MSNWPARGRTRTSRDSSSSVQVSAVSCTRDTTRWATGVMAPRAEVSTDADAAIHVQQPHPCMLQAVDHHLGEALHQLVAQLLVVVALAAQAGAVERDRAQRSRGAGLEVPGPADHLAGLDRVDHEPAAFRRVQLEGDSPAPDDVEGVGGLAFTEEEL